MAGLRELRARWVAWSDRFAALRPREKTLGIGAAGAVILLGGYALWIEPGLLQTTRLQKALVQQQEELAQLRNQVASLSTQNRDPDAANRATLKQLREQLSFVERDLRAFDRILVAPAQAPALLQTLLARHRGLTLISLTTLAPLPLIEAPAARPEADKAAAKPGATTPPGGNLFKHGIEVKLAGSYHDLLAYVAEIEASPQKLLWGGMSLAGNYPVSELTLTVYTLSLDATWLVV